MITVRWPRAEARFPQVEFRRIFRQIRRPATEDAAMVTAYTDGVVTLRSNRRLDGYHEAADMSGMQGVKAGDFVIHGLDILRGSVGISDADGAMSSVCVICAPIADDEPRYFAWQIRAQAASGLPRALARGVREGGADFRRWDTLAELPVLYPPPTIQRAIADFLDTETTRIDALIAKKERMAEVLAERQREYERYVVTGAERPVNEGHWATGSALIPYIPEKWALVRARFLCDVDTGSSDTDESVEGGDYPFFVRSQTPQSSNRYIFDGEAVLTAGDGAGVGKVFHHFIGRFDAHQRVYVLHRFRRVTGRFFFYYFSALFGIAALDGSAKSTVDSVRRHMITEMPVVVPPIEEQDRLVQLLDSSRERTEALQNHLQEQLELLREHREALISAAVTGELEVPRVAA
jgi:type I restriction enzyme S subunit